MGQPGTTDPPAGDGPARSIVAVTNGAKRVGSKNPPLKVVLSLWKGKEV